MQVCCVVLCDVVLGRLLDTDIIILCLLYSYSKPQKLQRAGLFFMALVAATAFFATGSASDQLMTTLKYLTVSQQASEQEIHSSLSLPLPTCSALFCCVLFYFVALRCVLMCSV